MIVYWDLAAAWNFILDYILLLGTLCLSGRPVRRVRLALAALLGAVWSVAALALPAARWLALPVMLLMCRAAFGRTERFLRLTLLFCMVSCALGGAVVLLGSVTGSLRRLAYGILSARLPWGVFFAAALLSRVLLGVVFRGGARHTGGELMRCRVTCGVRRAELTLLNDTGNTLTDPLTGKGVPVISREAARGLFDGEPARTLRCRTAGGETVLPAYRCDALTAEGRELGARLIAVSEEAFGNGHQGLWCGGSEGLFRENGGRAGMEVRGK